MMSLTRQALTCFLIVLVVAVCGNAQSTSSKEIASISGKVTFHGEAVKGVIVVLRSMEPTSFRKLTNYRGVTNAKGEYRIKNVLPGSYSVSPTATALVFEGDSSGGQSLIINGSETVEDFDFSLIRGGVITGKVVDSDGQPMIEEEVYAFPQRDPGLGSVRPVAITDDRGIYRIFAMRPGSYVIAAGRDDAARFSGRPSPIPYSRTYYPGVTDSAQAKVIEVSDGSEATDVDITLSRPLITYTASGRIVSGETGEPLPEVPYGFSRYNGSNSSSTMTPGVITNSRGEFKIQNLPPGQYAVLVRPQAERDFRAEELRFQIVDQDVTDLVVKTVKGASLSGVVVLEGTTDAPVIKESRDARLVVFVATESSRFGTSGVEAVLRPDGTFRFGGLPTGNATFMFGSSRYMRIIRVERDGVIQPAGIEVKQGEDIRGIRIIANYSDASIRGKVELQNGTMPAKGQMLLRAKKLDSANPLYFSAQPDPRGQFVFDSLPPGTYEVAAGVFVPGSRQPVVQASEQVVVAAGSTANTVIKLSLSPLQPRP